MANPDPKSFDTLEAAQAEIARCYRVVDNAADMADAIAQGLAALLPEITEARADIARLLGEAR